MPDWVRHDKFFLRLLPDAVFELEGQQLSCFGSEFAGEFLEHVLAESADHCLNCVFALDAAAFEVEKLVFADAAGGRFVFGGGASVCDGDIRERVCRTLVAHEHAVALGVVAGTRGRFVDVHFSAVGIATVVGADTLADDGALGVLADVDHLGAGIGLHVPVGEGHAVEFTDGIVAQQYAARVLPRDGGARLDLRPADAAVLARTLAALGHEVVHTAGSRLTVARVPVLHGGILDAGVVLRHKFHDGAVQLLAAEFRRGAAFQVAYARAFVGDNQGAFELARFLVVDAEVGGKVHRALDSGRDVHETSVAKDCAVECRKVVVASWDHASQVFLDEFGVFLDGVADGAEQNAHFHEFALMAGVNAHRVKDRVHGHVGKALLFVQRNAELFEGGQEFRVHVFNLFVAFLGLRGGVVDDVLQVDRSKTQFAPVRLLHGLELFIRFQSEIEHELRFTAELGRPADDIFVQTFLEGLVLDIRYKTVFVVFAHFIPFCGRKDRK